VPISKERSNERRDLAVSALLLAHPRKAGPGMSIASAFLDELTEHKFTQLAERLAPYLPAQQTGDGWLRGAKKISDYIDCPVSRVYALSSAGRIPVEHDGSILIARKSELDAWVRAGGGKRP
jgi:hypothetical protein